MVSHNNIQNIVQQWIKNTKMLRDWWIKSLRMVQHQLWWEGFDWLSTEHLLKAIREIENELNEGQEKGREEKLIPKRNSY